MTENHRICQLSIFFITLVTVFIAIPQASSALQRDASALLKLRSAGHVLGFQKSGVLVANGKHLLFEEFVGANAVMPARLGNTSSTAAAQILEQVYYPELWTNITLVYDKPHSGIVRSTFHIEPGGNPDQIALHYNAPAHLDDAGNLVFSFASGTMTASAPVAWQEIGGRRQTVEVAFEVHKSGATVTFSLGAYDADFPLMIDPTLKWNTFLGSTSDDYCNGIALDNAGYAYVTGYCYGTWGTPVAGPAGGMEAFVAKLDSDGALVWNTFVGSNAYDEGRGIAVDGEGNVFITGYCDKSWGTPVNAFAGVAESYYEAFAVKLDSDGGYVWHTFMGGANNSDFGNAIAVDGSGNVYVTGHSSASWGSPVAGHSSGYDGFAIKLNSSGARLWNTFMGGSSHDYGKGIAVDGSGNVYVCGNASTTWGTPVNAYAGGTDAFAVKLNGNSGARVWNTFMGSSSSSNADIAGGIAVDNSGNVFIAGESYQTWGTPVNAHAGGGDAFAVKLNSSGGYVWHTFLGSSYTEYGNAIALDTEGNIYVAGEGNLAWGDPITPYTGGYDAFAAKLNGSGERQWHAFMGCSLTDEAEGIAVDADGDVYVTGRSYYSWGSPINAHTTGSANYDGFVAKIVAKDDPKLPIGSLIPLLLDDSGE